MKNLPLNVVFVILLIMGLFTPVDAAESFITFTEYTEEGRALTLSPGLNRYDVDINSYIDVRLNPEILIKTSNLTNPTLEKLQKEVNDLSLLLSKSRSQLQSYVADISTLYTQLQKKPTPELEAAFRQKLASHGALIETLLDVLEPVVGIEKLDEALSTPDPLYTDLFNLLTEHIKDVQERLYAENNRVIEESKLIINLWCIQQSKDKAPSAVHLNNYDNLQSGSARVIDKVSFTMTPEEQSHLRDSLKFHEDLVEMAQEFTDRKGEINQLLLELQKQFQADLQKLKNALLTKESELMINAAQEEIAKIPSDPNIQLLAQNLQDLAAAYQKFAELQKQYNKLLGALNTRNSGDPISFYATLTEEFSAFKNQLVLVLNSHAAETITEIAKNLEDCLVSAAGSLSSTAYQKTRGVLTSSQSWYTYFADLEATVKENNYFADFSAALNSLLSRLSYTSAFEKLPVNSKAPEEIRQVALAKAEPTTIDIPRTLRQDGDTYTLYVQIYQNETAITRQEHAFRVKCYGAYSNWKTSLVFVKSPKETAFKPATGVSWILHYRPRPKEGFSNPFYDNILNPGAGLSSTMFFTEYQIEYGLGVTLTLFNDILQVGYGINFQHKDAENQTYFFVGASLFDFLKQNPQTM